MKHYHRFRLFLETVETLAVVAAAAALIYFIWEALPMIPIYD